MIHSGHGHELEKPTAIAWSKVPYSLCIGARYQTDRDPNYAVLTESDGPFYFAGEHVSHVGAWQEGAMLSARRAINVTPAQLPDPNLQPTGAQTISGMQTMLQSDWNLL